MVGGGASAIPAYRPHEQYSMGPGRATLQGRFLPDDLRQQLQHRAYLLQAQVRSSVLGGGDRTWLHARWLTLWVEHLMSNFPRAPS